MFVIAPSAAACSFACGCLHRSVRDGFTTNPTAADDVRIAFLPRTVFSNGLNSQVEVIQKPSVVVRFQPVIEVNLVEVGSHNFLA